jgi:membrane-associated phospholipid phosphatase
VVWATGLTLASTVGYLRIAADKHYFSDVVTAAIIGSIVGVGAGDRCRRRRKWR